MSASVIAGLAQRLSAANPVDAREQREIFERIRELRSAFDGPLDPETHRCLEAAGMLVAYLARMGSLAGTDVREIAVRLLRMAADLEQGSAPGSPPPLPSEAPAAGKTHLLRRSPADPAPQAGEAAERTAVDVMGDMLLGQILLKRGHILEEHIHQAIKVQRATHLRIGDILVKIGACSRAQLEDALRQQAENRRLHVSLSADRRESLDPRATRGTGLKLVGEVMLGEILIQRNVITRRQLERALEVQKQEGLRIGDALVKIGATTIEQVEHALRIQGRERRFGTRSQKDGSH